MNQARIKIGDRRKHPRRASFIIVQYKVKEGTFRDIIKNISAEGMFVKTRRIIAIDQPIRLRFPLFDFNHTLNIGGRVIRCTTGGFAVSFDKSITGLISKKGRLPKIVHEIDLMKNPSNDGT